MAASPDRPVPSPAPSIQLRCDARGLSADAEMVDRLACLAVAARRVGGELWLWQPPSALLELIDFMGLGDVLQEDREELRSQPPGLDG